MGKLLVVADVHIHDYSNRNPQNGFRLSQWKVVADNIIEVGKTEGCDTIVFAGDIVEKSIIRSYIQAEVKNFLYKVMEHFKQGYIIWGNHDLDGRSAVQSQVDSVLGIILPSNLYYAHQKILKIDNTTVGFSNWQPEFDLSWINSKVDVLITHARICYSPSGGDFFKSQDLDESKFDIAICGDIHKPAELGKYISVGIPQRCKMGDSEFCTGIILDTNQKSWQRVNLNPHDNLLKFAYTEDPNLEGYQVSDNTWYVYKKKFDPTSGVSISSIIPSWEDLNNLITGLVIKNNLQNAHTEVLKLIKNPDAGEVDFNFTLKSLHCSNWRSIDDLRLEFNEGDKILFRGKVGSGKSSILSAIKYAFTSTRSLSSFVQFGQKNCKTTVEFVYQGNTYELTRGTDVYGLKMNGVDLKYTGKTYFESDIKTRFPFTEYLDLLFVDHKEWFGNMSDEVRNTLLGKCLKLDKIDILNNAAEILLDKVKKEYNAHQGKYNEVKTKFDFVNGKLMSISVPTTSKSELESQRQIGLEIQRKNSEWVNYLKTCNTLSSQLELSEQKVKELQVEILGFTDKSILDDEILKIQESIKICQAEISSLSNIELQVKYKEKDINNLKAEGNKIWNELQVLGNSNICPNCGQVIKDTTVLDKHKKELSDKISEIKLKVDSETQELLRLNETWAKAKDRFLELSKELENMNNQISEIKFKKSYQESKQKEFSEYSAQVEGCKNKLKSFGQIPPKVELPDNFMNIMQNINDQINIWNNYEQLYSEAGIYKSELDIAEAEKLKLENIISELKAYIGLTSPVGQCYFEILTKLATEFSDNLVKYNVIKTNSRGKDHLDLVTYFNNNGNLVEYSACSNGQKTISDIHIMKSIFPRIGLLVMDEFLAHLDTETHDFCIELITGMNIGCLMLSSHMESLTAFNNKTCNITLEQGISKVTLE